jgi:dTMP kinase
VSKGSGFFLVLDGIDGCGKSTLSKHLADYFKNNYQKIFSTYLTAEPSTGVIGKIIRTFLKDPSIPASVDALLFAADRIDHCNREILPHLEKGSLVISDRYRESSYIYQSLQGEGEGKGITLDWIKSLNKFSFTPDLTIILDIDPEVSLNRKIEQNQADPEAMEKFENLSFQKQIRAEFKSLVSSSIAGKEEIFHIINADQPIEKVLAEVLEVLTPLLGKKGLLN